jgi:hypothetical protein
MEMITKEWWRAVTAFVPQMSNACDQTTLRLLGPLMQLIAKRGEALGKTDVVRVARCMSEKEFKAMQNSQKVQQSLSGTTHVAIPASKNAFGRQAKPGSVYVEFDVPAGSVKGTGPWGKILGPNSLESRNAKFKGRKPYEMPNATNIKEIARKPENQNISGSLEKSEDKRTKIQRQNECQTQ